jgi:hypothetical protein
VGSAGTALVPPCGFDAHGVLGEGDASGLQVVILLDCVIYQITYIIDP